MGKATAVAMVLILPFAWLLMDGDVCFVCGWRLAKKAWRAPRPPKPAKPEPPKHAHLSEES